MIDFEFFMLLKIFQTSRIFMQIYDIAEKLDKNLVSKINYETVIG